MLDINDFVKERNGDPAKIKESQRRRHAPEAAVDEIIELFEDHRRTQYDAGTTKGAEINKVKKQMGENKKKKGDPEEFKTLMSQKDALEKEKKELEELAQQKYTALMKKAKSIGNYVHESVPVSDNEDNNELIRKWEPEGVTVEKKDCMSHHEVLTRIGGYDPERGVKIAGHRAYCLTDPGLFLNLGLINYGLHFLKKRGYTAVQPPYMMNKDSMAKTAQLEQFDEELYKVTEKENDPASDKYLIATSEQPISAMHEGEWLNEKELPIKYAGYSTISRHHRLWRVSALALSLPFGLQARGIFRQLPHIRQELRLAWDPPSQHFGHLNPILALVVLQDTAERTLGGAEG